MSHVCFVAFLLFVQFSQSICDLISLNNSNCSLSFNIKTIYESNQIRTDFPIEFIGNYNVACDVQNLTAYYKLTPLTILVFGNYKNEEENLKSMIELNSTKQFYFNISQSSTIRLCILTYDDANDEDDDDNDYRICRQIHIGINTLYDFWNIPMQVFYICIICLISVYYILLFLREKWRKGSKKRKTKRPHVKPLPIVSETKHDTFENEKVHEDDTSGEENEENDENEE